MDSLYGTIFCIFEFYLCWLREDLFVGDVISDDVVFAGYRLFYGFGLIVDVIDLSHCRG